MIKALLGPLWSKLAAMSAALVAIAAVYWRGRADARVAGERDALKGEVDARRRADVAAAEYRRDGAEERLRKGEFCIVFLALLLAACSGGATSGKPFCPELARYPAPLQIRAAEELAGLPHDAALRLLIADYGDLRARIRAACPVGATGG